MSPQELDLIISAVNAKMQQLKPTADERGALSLEQAIITGILSIACVALVVIIAGAITTAQARITAG